MAKLLTALALLTLLAPALASAQEENEESQPRQEPSRGTRSQLSNDSDAEEVPGWAEDWRYIWLDAKKNGSLRLSGKLTHPYVAVGTNEVFAVLEVRSLNFPQERRQPVNAAIILDRSASMKGARLNVLKKAAIDLLTVLTPRDRLAIIQVSDEPDALDSMLCTPENKQKMIAYIRDLKPQGGSDLSAGLAEAYDQVSKNKRSYVFHRVLLISDGRPNKGMADPDGLAEIARKVRESENIHTSTLTIGNESDVDLMRGIAVQGWGFTGNLEDASQLFRIGRRLENDLVRKTAEAVELVLKPAENVKVIDVMEYAAEPRGDSLVVPLHELAQKERLTVVLRLSVLGQNDGSKADVLAVHLAYHDMLVDREAEADLQLSAPVTADDAKVKNSIDPKVMLIAARAVASRGMARAQDRYDEGMEPDAKLMLQDTRDFLKETAAATGIITEDEIGQVQQLEQRLFKKTEPPPRPNNKKKKRRT